MEKLHEPFRHSACEDVVDHLMKAIAAAILVCALSIFASPAAAATPVTTSVAVPANGFYGAGDPLAFTVNFSEPVLVTGTPSLSVIIGAQTRQASYVGGSGTSALTFSYTVQPGEVDMDGISLVATIQLNGGTIQNTGLEAADLTLNGTGSLSGVLVNATAPVVLSSTLAGSPSPNASTITFDVTFSEPVTGVDTSDFSLTTTGTAQGTIASVSGSSSNYSVTVNAIQGTGTLRLNVVANGTILGSGGTAMTAAFTGGSVFSAAPSAVAELSALSPSAGTLQPAFSPSVLNYTMDVANSVTALSLTPTASDPNAAIDVHGQTVASGSSSAAISLVPGQTTIAIVVTAQNGVTSKTYQVVVTRNSTLPTASSRTISVEAGETVRVDLTEGSTGGPFSNAAIVSVSDPAAGTTRLEAANPRYDLVFSSDPAFAGTMTVQYTLSNTNGTSAPATIGFVVTGRPDPSEDPEVAGLINAQVESANRFATTQVRNFNNRLERLHDEGDRRRNSMAVSLGYAEPQPENAADPAFRELLKNRDQGSEGSGDLSTPDLYPSRLAVWTGGYVNFADRDSTGLDYTTVGVSAGMDYRFSPDLVAGIGLGYGRDGTDVGSNGTESRGKAYSAALYASYSPFGSVFLDGLIGGSWLDFESRRYVTGSGDFATGDRNGRQLFGSITASYDRRSESWLVSPYGRLDFSRSWLDGFTEKGNDALKYGDQTADTLSGIIGLRLEYTMPTDWGVLKPGAQVEYVHDFAGSSTVNLGYADIEGLPYALKTEESDSDYVTIGASLNAAFENDWTAGIDWRMAVAAEVRNYAVGLKVGKQF